MTAPALTFTPHECDRSFRIIPEKSYDYKYFVQGAITDDKGNLVLDKEGNPIQEGKPDVIYQWPKGHPALGHWFFKGGKDGKGELLDKRPDWIDDPWDPETYHQELTAKRVDRGLSEVQGRELALAYLERLRASKNPAMTLQDALSELTSGDTISKEDTSGYAHLKAANPEVDVPEKAAAQPKRKKATAKKFVKGITYRAK